MVNKIENKKFLGMEVRVVNEEYINCLSGNYLIVFSDRYKVGSTCNIRKRLSFYKPYSYSIKEIWFYPNYNYNILERKILSSINDELWFGQEWFYGNLKGEEFINMCNEMYEGIHIKSYNEDYKLTEGDILKTIATIYPDKLRLEFEYNLKIIESCMKYTKTTDTNLNNFINFYNSTTLQNKSKVVNLILSKNRAIDEIINMIDVYFGHGQHLLGNILYLDRLLNDFEDDEVREFVMSKFVNAYEFTNSHKTAGEMALKLAIKKYNL